VIVWQMQDERFDADLKANLDTRSTTVGSPIDS
jgi:hypothetical protein